MEGHQHRAGQSASLAVDGGQSATKVRFRAEDGSVRDIELPGLRTDVPLLPQLAGAIEQAHAEFGEFAVAVFGVTGLTDSDRDAQFLLDAGRPRGLRRVGLAHDSLTAYLSALGAAPGVVVAAGTGAVTFAAGPQRSARVDGWGNIMGDAGSGYWIGREVLDAAMRAHDGRGRPTTLTDVVQREFSRLESAYIELQNDPARVRRVAAFARAAAELAPSDAVARDIIERAGAELAGSVVAAWERVGDGAEDPHVCTLGGVFRGALITAAFAEHVHARYPGATIAHGHPHALDGVESLTNLPRTSPLWSQVCWAGPETPAAAGAL